MNLFHTKGPGLFSLSAGKAVWTGFSLRLLVPRRNFRRRFPSAHSPLCQSLVSAFLLRRLSDRPPPLVLDGCVWQPSQSGRLPASSRSWPPRIAVFSQETRHPEPRLSIASR